MGRLGGIFRGKAAKPNLGASYSMKPKVAAQPGSVGSLPAGNVRQDVFPTSPPKPREYGGQGPVTQPVVQPPMGPDTSWQDSTYNTTTSGIKTGLTNLQGYLTNSGTSLGADYGVNFEYAPTKDDPSTPDVNEANPFALKQLGTNPDGSPKYFDIAKDVDVTNPFSRAALLNRTHKQNDAGNTNSYAARGQLYSGSLQNAKDSENFGYLGGQNALTTDFAGKFGGLYKQWLDANTTGTQQGIDAQAAAIERHKNDPAPDTGVNTGGAAAPGTNPNQYPNSSQGGKQPKESVSDAVKKYLAKQKKATNAGATYSMGKKKNSAGKTGGALAPGGK